MRFGILVIDRLGKSDALANALSGSGRSSDRAVYVVGESEIDSLANALAMFGGSGGQMLGEEPIIVQEFNTMMAMRLPFSEAIGKEDGYPGTYESLIKAAKLRVAELTRTRK